MSVESKIIELSKLNNINNILHIGAHLGNEIDFYAKLNPEKIYWFEANPDLIEGLIQNINRYPNIEQKVFNYAISSETKKIKFNIIYSDDLTNTGCSSLLELKHHKSQYPHIKKVKEVIIDSVNIDDFLIKNELITDFDLINMDIQGSEFDVLSNSKLLFSQNLREQFFILETTTDELYEGQKLETDIINLMDSNGYKKIHYEYMAHNWGDTIFSKK